MSARTWCQVPWCPWRATAATGTQALALLVEHIEHEHELPSKKALVTLPNLESKNP